MSVKTFAPIEVPNFGGLVTLVDPADVPVGLSPDVQDMEFFPGMVRTRPGLSALAILTADLAASVTGMFNYILPTLQPSLLVYNSTGPLEMYDVEAGTKFTLLSNTFIPNGKMRGTQLFRSAWLAFGDGKHGLFPGMRVSAETIALASTQLDKIGLANPVGDALSAAENATAGNITAGFHNLVCIFETRSGFRTAPSSLANSQGASPFRNFNATGGKTVDVLNIPIGPPNTVRRILAFTAAQSISGPGGEFYFIPGSRMVIEDNTTTSVTALDFTDANLLNGVNVDRLFRRILLADPAGITTYGTRAVYWGVRKNLDHDYTPNPDKILVNLGFDGGFHTASGFETPNGWEPSGAGASTGGAKNSTSVLGGGFSYQMTGNGTDLTIGERLISPSVAPSKWFGVVQPKRNYRIRAWVRRLTGTGGRLEIKVSGSAAPGLNLGPAAMGSTFAAFEARLIDAADNLASLGALFMHLTDTPAVTDSIVVDSIQIFPEDEPFDETTVYVSDPEDPEAVDGIDGLIIVSPSDGQAIRNVFEIRGYLFIVKERSIYVTREDGVNPPSRWEVNQVSERVGTPSTHGVGIGDDWAVIAHRTGLWYFDGGPLTEDKKLSLEIQPTWDRINWQFGHLIEVRVDTRKKRIYVSVPLDAGTTPNKVLVLDYVEGFGNPLGQGSGRKWSLWNIAAGSMALLERTNGTEDFLFGNMAGNRKIYRLDPAVFTDDGVDIPWAYQVAFLEHPPGRNLFGYLTADVKGAGTLVMTAYKNDLSQPVSLNSIALVNPNIKDIEKMLNLRAERVSFKFTGTGAANWMSMADLVVYAKKEPWSPVRGHN